MDRAFAAAGCGPADGWRRPALSAVLDETESWGKFTHRIHRARPVGRSERRFRILLSVVPIALKT